MANSAPILDGVVKQPLPNGSGPLGDYIISFATVADALPAWGTFPFTRDKLLREFWPTEPILASAIYTTVARYVAFGNTFVGPDRMVNLAQKMWDNVEWGAGPEVMLTKFLIDIFTQDNGGWLQVVRAQDSPSSPCITLKHLDSQRCVRTGRPEEPIIYYDMYNMGHRLKWYQVVEGVEFPSPVESMRGMQYCAVTRLLRAAQIIRDITLYKNEKISGRFNRVIHLVSGVQKITLDDAIRSHSMEADSQGLSRYIQPLVIASLDPTAKVDVASIELASLPDGFDEEAAMKWYVNQLALAFGQDYQDFAPLPGGNLGTAQQSETLHLKSRGKGPRLFMKLMENIMNTRGILPSSVRFVYGDQDVAEDMQHSRLFLNRVTAISNLIKNGVIDPVVARQMLADEGYLKEEYLRQLGERDLTPDRDETREPPDAP